MIARNHPRRGNAGCVTSVAPKKLAWALILIGAFGFAAQGCHSQKSSAGPSIEFTHIPPAAQGGRERVDTISGRAGAAFLRMASLRCEPKDPNKDERPCQLLRCNTGHASCIATSRVVPCEHVRPQDLKSGGQSLL